MTIKHEPLALDSSGPKELLADAKGSAKAAGKKVASRGARLVEFSKDNVEALKASGRIAATGAKALGEEVVDNVKREFAAASDGPKNLSGVKSLLESARDDTKAFGQHIGKVAGDVGEPLKSRYATVTAKPEAKAAKPASPIVKSAKSKAEVAADAVEATVP